MCTSSPSDEHFHVPEGSSASLFEAGFERLRIILGFKNQKELADILEIRQSSISDAKRRDVIPADWAMKLLRKERINPHWIYVGLPPMRIGDQSCEPRIDFCARQSSFLQKFAAQSLSIIAMQDSSMEPEIPRDSHVGINTDDRELVSGALYGVDLPNEGFTIRRILTTGSRKATLSAGNPAIPAITLTQSKLEPMIQGRAVWIKTSP